MSILALQPGLGASTPLLFNHRFPLILDIMSRVRFRGRDRVRCIFLDNNSDAGSTKDVDPRNVSCLAKSR